MFNENVAFNNIDWLLHHKTKPNHIIAQSAGAVEYTDCTSAEG